MAEAVEIGARIKNLRIKNNLTQQELADKLQYKSRSTINKIELGINEIHPTKIYAFAKVLNTSPEYILGWTDNKNIFENKIEIVLEDNSILKYSFDKDNIDKIINYINSLKN